MKISKGMFWVFQLLLLALSQAGAAKARIDPKSAGARSQKGKSVKEPKTSGKPAPKKASEKDELSALLLSSPWCSFSYNKVSGAANTKRVQFHGDGTWSDNSRYEGYSGGDGGSMASQHDSGSAGQWRVEGDRLFMSGPDLNLVPVDLQVRQNSNGYPILLADGVEYAQCK